MVSPRVSLALLMAAAASVHAQAGVASPDGRNQVTISIRDGGCITVCRATTAR